MRSKLIISGDNLIRFKAGAGVVYTHTQEELNNIMRERETATRGAIRQYKNTDTGTTFCQINKRKAEKMFNQGYTIYLHPYKLNPVSRWQTPMPCNKMGGEFETILNEFIYYNCNAESGRYPNYYVKLDDLIGFNFCNAIAGGNNILTTK